MNTLGEMIRTLVVIGALAASVCACKERSGSEPSRGHEHHEDAPVAEASAASAASASAASTSTPALWEPIDKKFTGCEGG
jgi:hypothetical protein